MTNALRQLLESVAASGKAATRDEITAGLPSTSTASGRESDRRVVSTAVKRIVLLRGDDHDSDDPDQEIEDLISATEERFSAGLADRLAGEIRSSRDNSSAAIDRRRAQAEANRQKISDLVEMLKHAGLEGGVDLHEVRKLRLRPDLTAQQREQFERDVIKAGKRVADIHKSGAQQSARLVAQNAANELSDYLASRQHVDPLRDEDDPRALAAAIVARQRGE